MKSAKILLIGAFTALFCVGVLLVDKAAATPSTHIWSPSTDIQAGGTAHITADVYLPSESDATGAKPDTVTNFGLTGGYWPMPDKLGIEYGFDHIAGYGELDDYPIYFNAKVGLVEGSFGSYFPALAVGGYAFGTEHDKTDYNVYYVKAAKTLALNDFSLGRFSAGYFQGRSKLLVDKYSNSDNKGVLLAWERVIPEISEKLWVCVDYQGSDSGLGALAPGFSWKVADNTSLLIGYVFPNNSDLAQTVTIQIDIDLDFK